MQNWDALIKALGKRLTMGVLMCAMGGCAVLPYRPFMKAAQPGNPCTTEAPADKLRSTPELPDDKSYTLHFVEFDDQGWTFPDGNAANDAAGTPSRQIDCAIAGLRRTLEDEDAKVLSFVYVHGWKHSADNDDRDVKRFRALLKSRTTLFPDRRIVGIFVGWQGNTVDVWGLNNLTFWGRKNAAHHVAEGRVRELFSRIRGLRAHWNGPNAKSEHDCDREPDGVDSCKLRTIMIGHSFGGLILYASAAPYLLEMLSVDRDLPAAQKRPRAARARSIADLIVLLNPAFEGSRYEPLFEVSRHYRAGENEPPLLVMLTSTADWATKNAFPVARWFNSIFQYPSSSDDQSLAMRRTPGHIERYLTHKLCLGEAECALAPAAAVSTAEPELRPDASRRFCDGLVLRAYESASIPDRPVVWNVRTHAEVIPNHNDIDGEAVICFIEKLYRDVTGRSNAARGDDPAPATAQGAGLGQAARQSAGIVPPR